MNSPDVAAALSAGAPDAAGQLYDAHAEALFQYCWLTLRNSSHAQTAVCDALVQAGARVAELSDPGTLRAWLFTMARAECHRHPLPSLGDTDEPIARPEQPDAALRIMAWNSVMSLDLVERQALDLNTRHGMTAAEIGLILALPLPGTTELLSAAKETLERALGAEILVSRDSQECPGRTEAIHGWTGTVTPAFRERLLSHAVSCPVCAPRLPRNVSAGRIFGLLPAPPLDREARSQVISRVGERVRAAAADRGPAEAGVAPSPVAPSPPVPELEPVSEAAPTPLDPAAPDPVVPDPAASAGAASAGTASAGAGEQLPVQIGTPELAILPAGVPETPVPKAPAPRTLAARPASAPKARPAPAPRASQPAAAEARSAPRTPRQPQKPRRPQKPQEPQKPRKRRHGIRLFAGMGAAVAALGVAATLAYGSLGGNRAQLSGSDTRYVPGSQASQAGPHGPLPSPYAPSPTPRTSGRPKKSTLASPAVGAGHADAVASGKAAGPRGATIVTHGQGPHQTVTVALRPGSSASSASSSGTQTQAAAQLTVSPASLRLASGQSTGPVTLSVSGGTMAWTASASSGLSVSPASGRLGNGQTAQVTISVSGPRTSAGSGVVSIDGAQVTVSWAASAKASASPSAPTGGPGGSGGSGQPAPPARGRRHHRPDPGGSPDPVSS